MTKEKEQLVNLYMKLRKITWEQAIKELEAGELAKAWDILYKSKE
jgi:hypothetical protein